MSNDEIDTEPRPNHDRLVGWKEIAIFLGKSVRTTQRWAREYALPIQRIGVGASETVFALRAELDQWLSRARNPGEVEGRQVFLSYSQADKGVAGEVAEALRNAGLRVWIDAWELAAGDSIAQRIDEGLASSDILLVLLSPSAIASKWVQKELSTALSGELRDRAITVIPALVENCDVPPLLADRQYVDLRQDRPLGIRRLVEQIGSVPTLDFSKLDGRAFEEMVGELLISLGFSLHRAPLTQESGYDFAASYRARDPFGAERIETWLVDVKLYHDARVSIQALQQLLGVLVLAGGNKKGLVVTNGRLTSVAREFLEQGSDRSRHEVRVIDSTELTNLLIQHPEVTRKFFPPRQNL